ncbi:MAG: alanine--glyoxylate aminotransferase family protein [Candidatus Ratteibacteria bacterium]|nr:alanine--glyoxylate aminotransferase family protein [Candidatus Ratteibacteria bacterium]
MLKKRLFTPGPTSVPEEVLLEMASPVMHHRTDEFIKIAGEVFEDLKYVFQTKNDVFIIASSGTGAMEASVVNFLSEGDRVIVISGGKFGERFKDIALAYKLDVIPVELEWGKKMSTDRIKDLLEKNSSVKAVFGTLCETSTGTHFDIKCLGEIVSHYENTLFVVDTISSLGAIPCLTDEWKIDVVVTGSQKAFMLPPGLSFISVSEKAWKKAETSNLPKYYFNLKKYKKTLAKNDFPFTIPVSLVVGLRKSLNIIKTTGIEKIWEEHHLRGEATRQAMVAAGLKLLSESPSDAVTAVVLPEGIDGEKLVKVLRTKYGMSIAGGQDHLKGKIIRISHLGWQDEFDVLTAITGVGVGLKEMGCEIDIEKGLSVARQILFPSQ